MKKGRFLWSAHRITEKQKAGKARNIKEKQLKNSRNTVSKQHVVHLSSQRDKILYILGHISVRSITPQDFGSGVFFYLLILPLNENQQILTQILHLNLKKVIIHKMS